MARPISGAKPKDFRYTWKRLMHFLALQKYLLLLVGVLVIISAGVELIGTYLLKPIINEYILPADLSGLLAVLGFMALMYGGGVAATYGYTQIMVKAAQKIVCEMRNALFAKMQKLPLVFFDSRTHGDTMSRFTNDIDTLAEALNNSFAVVIKSFIQITGTLTLIVLLNWQLSIIVLICYLLMFAYILYSSRRSKYYYHFQQKHLGALNGFVEEMISGQKTLRAYSQEENTIKKLDKQNDETVDAYYRADYYGSMVGPSVNFVNNLSLSLVSFFGALLFLGGSISIGNISSFVLYSRKFSGPINEIANIIGELQSAFSAAERVFRLLDEEPEVADSPNAEGLTEAEGDVDLSHVNFGYTKDRQIIKDLSLHVPKGALVAIVGPTGAGKTTIINLLMRFYDVDSGEITLDHRPIKDLTRRSLRLNYSMVLQDTWLFTGTVYENIAYGSEKATREDVERVCKACGIHDYIRTLPAGYETVLEDDGANISKGQKQLMTIARAMLLESSLLILDEATSNVDTRTELRIQKAMRTLMADKTCFVIAHRLSTIRNADMILVVRDGEIVERGTHESLMQGDTFYRHLYNAQFA